MSTGRRVAITVASTLLLGVTTFGYQYSLGGLGDGSKAWGLAVLAAYGFALVGVFSVDRLWAVAPAGGAVGGTLFALSIHPTVEQWSSEAVPLAPSFVVALVGLFVGFNAAFLSSGLLARFLWEELRRRRSSVATVGGGGR